MAAGERGKGLVGGGGRGKGEGATDDELLLPILTRLSDVWGGGEGGCVSRVGADEEDVEEEVLQEGRCV
jgi:hypothetical protein